jgi:hypothetical protein
MMRHRGPFEVISKNKGTYQLKELASNVVAKFNAHLLRPFNHDTVNDNPREVALHAKQMFDIEKIINHKGNIKYKSSLKFLVKWKGFGNESNSCLGAMGKFEKQY